MQLQRSISLGTAGQSYTRVISGGRVLVRQGKQLIKILFSAQKVESRLDMPCEYTGQPIVVYRDQYYELGCDGVRKVMLEEFQTVDTTEFPSGFPSISSRAAYF